MVFVERLRQIYERAGEYADEIARLLTENAELREKLDAAREALREIVAAGDGWKELPDGDERWGAALVNEGRCAEAFRRARAILDTADDPSNV